MKEKNKKQENPEIRREIEEKKRSAVMYDEEEPDMFLYPGLFMGSTASATESTGLIQSVPPVPGLFEVYDELYSYRQAEPVSEEDEE